ncbi:MAG: cytochrome C oxidase subunit I, partial [Ignavibacteriae bacterium]
MASAAALFRICPRTGLQYHKSAESLIKLNAVAAVVVLLIGGVLALLITLTRWQAIHLIDADNFYLYLTAHGLDMLVVWIIFFEMAILYFCSSTLLRCRLATPRFAWLAFALMIIGTVTFNVAIFQGTSSVMMTSYVPMQAHP